VKALPAEAVTLAQLLVGAVHDDGPGEVAALLTRLDTAELYALTVTLAAMVPTDRTVTELLAWNDVAPPLPFPRSEITDRSQRAFQLLRRLA